MASPKTIALCSSAYFYEHVNNVSDELGGFGYKTLLPETAEKMRDSKNYDVESHRTWNRDPKNFVVKARLMRGHFDKIALADAILVINDHKKGQDGYVGGNVLMEMGLAFYLNKPIFILNDVPKDNPIYEEVHGMASKIINGDLTKIKL